MMQVENGIFAGTKWVVTHGLTEKPIPQWIRFAALAPDNRVYVAASIAGSEKFVFMCAFYDGITCLIEKGHIYVPTDWMSREYPAIAGTCAFIEKKVRDVLG